MRRATCRRSAVECGRPPSRSPRALVSTSYVSTSAATISRRIGSRCAGHPHVCARRAWSRWATRQVVATASPNVRRDRRSTTSMPPACAGYCLRSSRRWMQYARRALPARPDTADGTAMGMRRMGAGARRSSMPTRGPTHARRSSDHGSAQTPSTQASRGSASSSMRARRSGTLCTTTCSTATSSPDRRASSCSIGERRSTEISCTTWLCSRSGGRSTRRGGGALTSAPRSNAITARSASRYLTSPSGCDATSWTSQ